jgi:nucleoside-diphosphate-sugar epimerase
MRPLARSEPLRRVLVTGASGSIGSNLCRYFSDRGYKVTGLVRPTSSLRFLDGVDVELIRADLTDGRNPGLPADIDWVVHSAALVSDAGRDDECRSNILDATRNLMDWLAEDCVGLSRFVYVSTALVLGYGRPDISPDNPGRPAEFLPYVRWKKAAEQAVLDRFVDRGLPAVILRPADVFGPRDRTSCELFCRYARRGVPLRVGSGEHLFGFCYIDNFCLAAYRACISTGVVGRAYTVTNIKPMTWRRFFDFIQGRVSRPQRVGVPPVLVWGLALAQSAWRLVSPRFVPNMTLYSVRRVTSDTSYDISDTIRELGYRPDEDEEAQLAAIVDWYMKEAACKSP